MEKEKEREPNLHMIFSGYWIELQTNLHNQDKA